jgi:hypothetical protein
MRYTDVVYAYTAQRSRRNPGRGCRGHRTISVEPPALSSPRRRTRRLHSNLDWVKAQGFTSMQLRLDPAKLDDAPILRNLRVDSGQ